MKEKWKYIVIAVLTIVLMLSVYSCKIQKDGKERIINQNNISKQVEKVEKDNQEVEKREKELYPAIDKRVGQIKKTIVESNKRTKDEIQKANINTVASKFTQLGYSSCVISR